MTSDRGDRVGGARRPGAGRPRAAPGRTGARGGRGGAAGARRSRDGRPGRTARCRCSRATSATRRGRFVAAPRLVLCRACGPSFASRRRCDPADPSYPSIAAKHPAANWFEREVMDFFGLVPEGHPNPAAWRSPRRLAGRRVGAAQGLPDDAVVPRVARRLPPVPAGDRRRRVPGAGGTRARRHHRARTLSVRRRRRAGAVPAASAVLRAQGNREALRAAAVASRAVPRRVDLRRHGGRSRAGVRARDRASRRRGRAARARVACGSCCWSSSASTTTRPTSARWRPTSRSPCPRVGRRPCAKASSGCRTAVRHAAAARHDRPGRRQARSAAGGARCASRAPAWVREGVRRSDHAADRLPARSRIASTAPASSRIRRREISGSSGWPRARPAWTPTSGATIRTMPTRACASRCPSKTGGDVRARLMVRAREVEQSLSILHQVLDALPDRPARGAVAQTAARRARRRSGGWKRGAGRAPHWVATDERGEICPRQDHRPELPELAGARPRGAGQHHPGLPGDQQELQPLVFRKRPLETAGPSRTHVQHHREEPEDRGPDRGESVRRCRPSFGFPVIDFSRCTACDECARRVRPGAIQPRRRRAGRKTRHAVVRRVHPVPRVRGRLSRAGRQRLDTTSRSPRTRASSSRTTRVVRCRSGDGPWHVRAGWTLQQGPACDESAERLRERIRGRLGRSLHVRQVDAGSCNGCELEIAATTNPLYRPGTLRHPPRRQSAARRPAARHRAGDAQHGDRAAPDLRSGAGTAHRRGGRRVRVQRRDLRRGHLRARSAASIACCRWTSTFPAVRRVRRRSSTACSSRWACAKRGCTRKEPPPSPDPGTADCAVPSAQRAKGIAISRRT